jgi:hypothetical protein
MARRGVRTVEDARLAVSQVRAARAALMIAERSPRVRRAVLAQVRTGALAPSAVLAPALSAGRSISPAMRVMLVSVLGGQTVVCEPSRPVPVLAAVDTPAEGLPLAELARPHLVQSSALSAGQTKQALVVTALDATGGSVTAAMDLLEEQHGVRVGKSVAYEAARVWREARGQSSRLSRATA